MKSRVELDDELVRAAQEGDVRAFESLVRHYKSRLLNYLSWTMRSASEAEDVVQETFLRAYKGLKRFRGDSLFSTWLFKIAINNAHRSLAQNARYVFPNKTQLDAEGESMQLAIVDNETPDAIMESHEFIAELDDALDTLQPELRTALLLRELDGMSYDEIATVMVTPVGTVRSRIHRARDSIIPLLQHR